MSWRYRVSAVSKSEPMTKKEALNVDSLWAATARLDVGPRRAQERHGHYSGALGQRYCLWSFAGNQACLGMFKTGERRVLGNVKWATVDVELGRLYPSPFQHIEVQTAGSNRGIVAGRAATGKMAYNYAYADPQDCLSASSSNPCPTTRTPVPRIDADSLVTGLPQPLVYDQLQQRSRVLSV